MYMHRNVTDKFIGTVVSCDIISTGSWYGDLPDSVPKEVKLNRKDYYIEEIQHISIKKAISVKPLVLPMALNGSISRNL